MTNATEIRNGGHAATSRRPQGQVEVRAQKVESLAIATPVSSERRQKIFFHIGAYDAFSLFFFQSHEKRHSLNLNKECEVINNI